MKSKEEILEKIKQLEYESHLLDIVVKDYDEMKIKNSQIYLLNWVISE